MLYTSKFEGQSLAISEEKICSTLLVADELRNADFIWEGQRLFVVP